MNPITSPPIPGHTVSLDLIMALPVTPLGYNAAMSVTDKFTKRVTILPGKDTYGAEQWARVLLDGTINWGIIKAIVMDRDPK